MSQPHPSSTSLFPRSWNADQAQVRVGYLPDQGAVLVANLHKKEPVANFSELDGHPMVILLGPPGSRDGTRRILNNVTEALFQKHHRLHPLDPKQAQQVFQRHLQLERCFFEPSTGINPSSDLTYQGFYLRHLCVYTLHREGVSNIYVYRSGRLLHFQLTAQRFIQLTPGDVLILAHPDDMTALIRSKTLRFFYQLFFRLPFSMPTKQRGFQKLERQLKAPILGISIYTPLTDKATRPLVQTLVSLAFNRNHWLMMSVFGIWILILFFIQWFTL